MVYYNMLLLGINSSSASKVTKISTGQQTISGVTKPPITTNTKPSIGDHASKAAGYQATGYQATGVNSGTIGGCPPVASNTKTTSQSTDVTTKAVNKEHHYNSKIDQGICTLIFCMCILYVCTYVHSSTHLQCMLVLCTILLI